MRRLDSPLAGNTTEAEADHADAKADTTEVEADDAGAKTEVEADNARAGADTTKAVVSLTDEETRAGARWYFAYGSNMQADTLRGRRRIHPLDARVGRLRGHGLCFDIPIGPGERGVANLAVTADASVWGVVFLLTPEQHEHLDRTEGVPRGLYRRVCVEVETEVGVVSAETLISDLRDATRRPSYRYRTILVEGAREHGLPADYVATLETWSLAWDEREGAIN